MEENYISRPEHEEFKQRLEEENSRQNHRLNSLEDLMKSISAMSTSIEKLALNMENMLKEQVSQGKRLEVLESRDGEMWRKIVGYALTTILGLALGFIATKLGG